MSETSKFTLTELPVISTFIVKASESVPHVMTEIWSIKFPCAGNYGYWKISSNDTVYLRLRGLHGSEPMSSTYIEIIKQNSTGCDAKQLLSTLYIRYTGSGLKQHFSSDTEFSGDEFLRVFTYR
jgi:hypothetical protein